MTQLANVMKLKTKDPEVGDGVTVFRYTDRSAGTVTRVSKSGRVAWIKYDTSKRVDNNGMSECQSYIYAPNPDAREIRVTRRPNGEWKTYGRYVGGLKVAFGVRDEYHDFSF